MADLKGLHLLITRPVAQAKPWADQLQALGATTTGVPMLAIQPLTDSHSEQLIKTQLLRLDEYQMAIFVSHNAVTYGVDWIDHYWPQLPTKAQFFAVGASTAQYLQKKLDPINTQGQHSSVQSPMHAMNSEALLALPVLQQVNDRKILIFRGLGGRIHLSETLEARGALVDHCQLYKRCIPNTIDHKKIAQFRSSNQSQVVAVHSGETLENLCTATTADDTAWIKQQPLLVPGKRVAAIAHTLGFKTIIVAENATHESMIGALHDWRHQTTQR